MGKDPARRVRAGKKEVPAGAAFRALPAPPPAPPAPPYADDDPSEAVAEPRTYEEKEKAPAGPVIADERGVARETPDHTRVWSVALRLFPAPVRFPAKRVAAIDAGAKPGWVIGPSGIWRLIRGPASPRSPAVTLSAPRAMVRP